MLCYLNILGLDVIQNKKYVSHSQTKFIDEIIEITGDRSKQKV